MLREGVVHQRSLRIPLQSSWAGRLRREVMQQGDGGDLLVDGVVGIGHPQSPPDLGRIAIEIQQLGLRVITPVADQLHDAAQLTDGDRSEKERGVVAVGSATQRTGSPAARLPGCGHGPRPAS